MNKYIFSVLLLILACGCTQNNGHIGRLFGSWVLESATLNGQPYDMPANTNTYWSFQADIVRVQLEQDRYSYISRMGTFSELPEGILRLDFTHSDDNDASGTGQYKAPEWMGFTEQGVFNLLCSCSDGTLRLTYHRSSEETFVYIFSKTW